MAGATSKLKAAQEERRARAAASGSGGNFFKVEEDGEEQIRILEDLDEILEHAAYFHDMPPQPPKRKYGWFEICLDQDEEGNRIGAECPGCEGNAEDWETYKRRLILYANVIWRDAPVRKKNEKTGKWEDSGEKKDQLAVWEIRQSTVQDTLEQVHLTYKNLTTRDFVVRRRGTGFDTTYSLNPATNEEGDAVKTPLTADDKKLGEGKTDLSPLVTLKPIADWGKLPAGKKDKDGDGSEEKSPTGRANPFLKEKKDEPKEDEE